MPVIVNSRQAIDAKGVKYFIYHCVSEKGEGVQLFLNADQEAEYGKVLTEAVATKDEIQSMFSGRTQVDVVFNQRGRLESVGN